MNIITHFFLLFTNNKFFVVQMRKKISIMMYLNPYKPKFWVNLPYILLIYLKTFKLMKIE